MSGFNRKVAFTCSMNDKTYVLASAGRSGGSNDSGVIVREKNSTNFDSSEIFNHINSGGDRPATKLTIEDGFLHQPVIGWWDDYLYQRGEGNPVERSPGSDWQIARNETDRRWDFVEHPNDNSKRCVRVWKTGFWYSDAILHLECVPEKGRAHASLPDNNKPGQRWTVHFLK